MTISTVPGSNHLTQEQKSSWDEKGFIVIKGAISTAEADEFNAWFDELWTRRDEFSAEQTIDINAETPERARVFFRNVDESYREKPYKLHDLYLEAEEALELALKPTIVGPLGELLEGEPLLVNSISFERGSQQSAHTDTLFMPPPVEDKMAATWLALEDVTPGSGELFYLPGSHKIPLYLFSNGKPNVVGEEVPSYFEYMHAEIEKRGLQEEDFYPKKGDCLIWHSRLFHGGRPITNSGKTRRSYVCHFMREQDCRDMPDAHTIHPHDGAYYKRKAHLPLGKY